MSTTVEKSKRLGREDCLAAALEVLKSEGVGQVNVFRIARDLGVTSGSFSWHFKDRNELLQSLRDFWVRSQTEAILEKVDQGTLSERLLKLMESLSLKKRKIIQRHHRLLTSPVSANND